MQIVISQSGVVQSQVFTFSWQLQTWPVAAQ